MLKRWVLATAIALITTIGVDAADREGRRVRLGSIGVGYSHFNGPAWPYYSYYGPYSAYPYPFWLSPYIHPGLYSGFGYRPNLGEVKITAADRDASVYIDDAYAGIAGKLKNMWLEPGVYRIRVQDASGKSFERKVYVLTGKRLDIKAELRAPQGGSR